MENFVARSMPDITDNRAKLDELKSEIQDLQKKLDKLYTEADLMIWQVLGEQTVEDVQSELRQHFQKVGDVLKRLKSKKLKQQQFRSYALQKEIPHDKN